MSSFANDIIVYTRDHKDFTKRCDMSQVLRAFVIYNWTGIQFLTPMPGAL